MAFNRLLNKCNSKKFYFCLNPHQSPTYYNLAFHLEKKQWHHTRFAWRAHFNENYFQFPPHCAQALEFKHELAQLAAQYFPDIMPLTYSINDENWPLIIKNIIQDNNQSLVWILKPSMLNNGQYLKIFENIEQIAHYFASPHRMGGEQVLQQYITNPHLLQGPQWGHKYSIRMLVVLTNFKGAYLYPQGYFNIALEAYQPNNFQDLRSHLTNEHLLMNQYNVVQIPTQQYELFKTLYPVIKQYIIKILTGLNSKYKFFSLNNSNKNLYQDQKRLAFFGFDFMVDDTQKVWFLEANHAPCFPIDAEHPLQHRLYNAFWEAVINEFIDPRRTNAASHPIFESCLTN